VLTHGSQCAARRRVWSSPPTLVVMCHYAGGKTVDTREYDMWIPVFVSIAVSICLSYRRTKSKAERVPLMNT